MPDVNITEDLLAQYGFSMAFLSHNPELKAKFDQAVKESWSPARFQAAIRATKWYRTTQDSARQWDLLAAQDPKTAAARKSATLAQMRDAANTMGAYIPSSVYARLAENALRFGWNDAQIRDTLSQYVKVTNGHFYGAAATNAEDLQKMAWRNGIKLAPQTLQSWVQQIAGGNQTIESYRAHIREQAKSLAPAYSAQIDGGMDLYDIASPYIESTARILEMNPAKVDLFDPRIRSALSSKGADGKPSTKSLWQYEQELRKDPAWMKTKNAQDSIMSAGRQVLKDFGFSY